MNGDENMEDEEVFIKWQNCPFPNCGAPLYWMGFGYRQEKGYSDHWQCPVCGEHIDTPDEEMNLEWEQRRAGNTQGEYIDDSSFT